MFSLRRIHVLLLALFATLLLSAVAVAAPRSGSPLDNASAQARARGSFSYDARIQTTLTPGAALAQAGRSPQQQDLALRGRVDLNAETLDLQLIGGTGSFASQAGVVTIQVADGVARSRGADGAWQTITMPAGVFGPGSDVLSLLAAARDVSPAEPQQLGDQTLTRYRFQIDGPAFARQIRDQMQQQLRDQGKLPVGGQLALIDSYLAATGSGELLVAADGLPYRQTIQLSLPDAKRDETVQGTITVDYHAFAPASALARPLRWLTTFQWGGLALNLGLLLLVGAAAACLILFSSSRRLYRSLAILLVLVTVASPLLQAQPVAASSAAPLPATRAPAPAPARAAAPAPVALSVARQLVAGSDADKDGLTDSAEATIGTNAASADSDGDGLSDGIEVLEVGTAPMQRDTDSDGLSDGLELEPIPGPDGRIWHLDPFAADTNGDGQLDFFECVGNSFCPDLDGDAVPDAWDDDNDNDGVPDRIDAAPQAVVSGPRNPDGSLQGVPDGRLFLAASNANPGKTLLFDFTIRPTNPGRLWYSQSVLDWPSDDREGQIRRVLTDTLGLSGRFAEGDMRVTPSLEVKLPYVAGSFGGLPVKPGYTDPDMPSLSGVDLKKPAEIAAWFDRWLDSEKLTSYQITVRLNGPDRSLLAYVPLDIQRDPVGDAPVAFTARMLFRPQTNVVPPHEVRLAWNVQAKTDTCSAAPEPDSSVGETFNKAWWDALPTQQRAAEKYTRWAKLSSSERSERWCSNTANWSSNSASIIHTYYDDFYLAALDAREDRGVEVAVIAQHPDAGTAAFQPQLWNLARGLERAFVGGRDCDAATSAACSGNGQLDLTPAQIKARWDRAGNSGVGQAERWNIPADALSVRTTSFADEGASAALYFTTSQGATQQPPLLLSFLNDTFVAQDQARTALPTVLLARLHTTATLGLQGGATIADGHVSFNMADAPAITSASLSWKPFRYKGAGIWEQVNLAEAWPQIVPALVAPLQSNGASAANSSATRGAQDLLLTFYLALNSGRAGMVAVDGVITARTSAANADEHLAAPTQADAVAGTIVDSMVDSVLSAQQHRTLLVNVDRVGLLTALGNQRLSGDGGPAISLLLDVGQLPAEGNAALYSKAFAALEASLALPEPSEVPETRTLRAMQLGADGIDKANTLFGALDALKGAFETGQLVSASLLVRRGSETISKAVDALSTADRLGDAQSKLAGLLTDLNNVTQKVNAAADLVADAGQFSPDALGIVVEVVIFAGKLMAMIASGDVTFFTVTSLIAETAGSVAVNVFLLGALAAIVPVGTVIAALIGLIDAVIGLACGFSESIKERLDSISELLCEGIGGNLTKAVTALFWDTQPLLDMTADDRLTPTNWKMPPRPDSAGGAIGMVASNTLDVSADIVTRLSLNTKANYSGLQILQSANKLPNATFRYQFTTEEQKDDQKLNERLQLEQQQMRSSWVSSPPVGGFSQQVVTQTVTTTLTLDKAQLNWHPSGFYLAEGYAVPSLYCVLRTCGTYTKRDSNYLNLAPSFAFDIFPAALDGFMSLTDSDGDGGFRMAWDTTFPDLKDADGDRLYGRASGGSDPGDNAPDSDRDGLSDQYELQQAALGLNPLRADSDNDGLSDLEEIRRNLDPAVADMDNDGLTDSAELAGWEIIYGYAANDTPLRFRVTSDPRDPDTDNDGLLDIREQIYGFNPRVLSSNEPLQIQSRLNEPDGVNDGIVAAGSSVGFSAVISSTLRDRFALGLFEADLESSAPKPDLSPTAYRLGPLSSATLAGTLDLSAQTATTTTNILTRAGAIIADVQQLSGGRVLWLPFEEQDSAAGFADASPFGNNATCVGGACPDVTNASYSGRGLSFADGKALSVAHSPTLAATSFSLSLWVNPGDSSGSYRPIIEKAGGPNSQVTFHMGIAASSDKLRVVADSADCSVRAVDGTSLSALTMTSWNLITLVANGTTLKLYVNGTEDGSWAYSAGLCANSAPLSIVGPAGGALDEVAFFPYPMTPTQVQEQFRDPVLQLAFNGGTNDSSSLRQQVTSNGNGRLRIANSRDGDQVGAFGKRNWLDVATSASLNMAQGSGQFTLAAYVRPVPLAPDNGEWQAIMGKQDDVNTYPSLYINAAGKLKAEFGTGSALCASGATTRTLAAGAWNHVAVSYTGTQFVFYINGVESERLALSGACAAGSRPIGSSLYIGRSSPNATLSINRIEVLDEGDGIGNAEYEALWKGSRVWYQDNIDVGNYYPGALTSLALDGDDSFRFELKEEDSCEACHDLQVDVQLRNYQVNADGTWVYSDDGEGKLHWRLWNNWFNGDLDEVQIYRVALDAAGARDLFNNLNNRAYALQTRMEEPPTTTLFRDGSGNLQTGFCAGASCPTTGLPGRDGQAAAFDGNDAIVIAHRPTLDLTAGLTAAAWVKLADVNPDQKLISKYDPSTGGYTLGVVNGKLYGEVKDSAGNRTEVLGGTLSPGVWTHLAMSASPGQYLVGFVNGVEVQRTPLLQIQGNVVAVGRPIARTVTLYDDQGYEANSFGGMLWNTAGDVDSFDPSGFDNDNNEASSLRTNGACVRLYDDEDYGGDTVPVCDDTPLLLNFNDRAESLRHYGTPPRYNAGAGGLSLDRGPLQYLQIDPAQVGNPTFSTFSAAAWVRVSLSSEWHTIVARGDSGLPEGFSLRIDNQGRLVYQAGGGTFTSSGQVVSDTWTHVAVTHDGTTVRFYLNGSEAGAQSFTGNINDLSDPILVGRMAQCGSRSSCDFFNGTMRGLALYTRGLSASEVAQLRETPSGAAPAGRVLYLPLDADQGSNGDGASTFRTVQAPAFSTNDQPLTIGRAAWDNTMFARGLIDEVTLLEYAADSAEVAALVREAPLVRLALDDVLGSTGFVNVAGASASCGGATSSCPQAGARGRIREAAVFGAVDNSGLLLPDTTAPLLSFSVELWVRPEAVRPGEQLLVAKANPDGSNANLVLSLAPGALTPRLRVGSTELTAQRALNQGQWNHIVASFDGTLRLYINGTAEVGAPNGGDLSSGEPVRIGFHPGIGVGFNGMLDELSIYGYALSPTTVAAHYQYQESWFDVVERHQLTVDGDNPTVAFGLADNLVVGERPLRVSVAASDPTSRVRGVWYDADGDATEGPWLLADPSSDGTNWLFTYTPTGGGSFPLRVYAEDNFSHRSAVAGVNVRVDEQAPTVALSPALTAGTLRPTPGSAADDGTWLLNLVGTVSDNQAGTLAVVDEILGREGVLGSVTADVRDGAWSGVFRFSAPPNGRYSLKLHATDSVGNRRDAEAVVLTLDATAPVADVSIGGTQIGNPPAVTGLNALPGWATTQATTATDVLPPLLRGTISDTPSLPDTMLVVHAEEAAGATSFLDSSIFQLGGSCAGSACPSVVAGQSGQGLRFDGVDDQIGFTNLVARPAGGAYGLSLWARPSADERTLFTAADATGLSLELRAATGAFTVTARVGGAMTVVGGGALTPNSWNHLAVSFDGTLFTTYSGGALVQSTPVSATVAGFSRVWLGSRADAAPFYQGDADELSIYSVPLSAERVALLADAVRSPIAGATPRLLHVKDRENPSAALALTATLTSTGGLTLWSAPAPQQIEGMYQLDMETRDSLDNRRTLPGIWRGVIDTRAPQAELFFYRLTDGRTLVRCEVSDFNLDPTLIGCPAPSAQWRYTNLAETWYTALFPDTPRRVRMSTPTVILSGVVSNRMRACDSFGNCAEAVGTAAGVSGGLSAFTKPTPGQIITAPGPITLSGIALAEVGLRTLQVTSGATQVFSKSFTTETMDEWTTTINLDDGIYQLQATATAVNGTVYTDTLAPRLMVDRNPPTLYLPAAGTSGAPQLSGGKLAFTLDVTETVALGAVEAQLGNGAWQALDTGGLIDNRGRIQAALELSGLGILDGQQIELTLRASDQAGLVTILTRKLTLDTTAPRVTVAQAALDSSAGFLTTGDVQEGGGTPNMRLIVEIDGTRREYPIQLVAGAAGSWSWLVALPYDSSLTSASFSVIAVDPAGNQAQLPLQGLKLSYRSFLPLVGSAP